MQPDLPPVTPTSFPSNEPKNNTLAIISLGLSLASLPFLCLSAFFAFCACFSGLLTLGAVITGFIARNQIQTTGEKGNGMALAGIIIGGVQLILMLCFAIFLAIAAVVPAIGEIFSSIGSGLK